MMTATLLLLFAAGVWPTIVAALSPRTLASASCYYAGHAHLRCDVLCTFGGAGRLLQATSPGGTTGVREARRRRAYVTVHFRATLLAGSRITSAKNGSHSSCALVMMSCV